jgi:hypothetical protein
MNLAQRFRVNSPTVVSEVFDDEIIIIHLENGTYYSLDESGAAIWKSLQQGVSIAELAACVATSYAVSSEEIEHTVQQFMKELAQEKLITVDNTARPVAAQVDTVIGACVSSSQGRFTPPFLNKYTDMQDLLLLDPIHDVAEAGWPYVKSH